jgi:PKD repeat protein
MKKLSLSGLGLKLVLLATAIGATLTSAQAATYNGDLLIGFTTQSGNDLIYDLGAESSLTNGETWNLSSLLSGYNLTNVNWGVIGDKSVSGTRYVWTTTGGLPPNTVPNTAAWGNIDSSARSIYQNFGTAGAGQSLSIDTTDANSWNQQTINGGGPLQYVNVYENPNVQGVTSDSFYSLIANGSAPTLVGNFTLNSGGVLTFNVAASPPVAGFTGGPTNGFAPLQVVFTNASTGSITNWLWNFGDGHSITNATAGNVTNTYAAGSYTVTLTVTGQGGASINVHTNYVVASVAPPVASFTGAPTNGFAPLQVVFTNTSTGSITNWVWNFGNGTIITNTTSSNVTNTYAAGSYTVTLTVTGAGGASTNVQTSYIVASPRPTIGNVTLSGGRLVFSGTNCPAGAQYRILTSTNVAWPLSSWIPVVTNTFLGNGSYSYTNSNSTTNPAAFFRLVSP